MDYGLTEREKQFQNKVRQLAEAKIKPYAARADETGEYPWESHRAMAGAGLYGLIIPKAYGGLEKGHLALCLAAEEVAKCDPSCGVILTSSTLLAHDILHSGTDEQKRKYVPLVARGKSQGTIGMTEYGAGSDVSRMETTAVPSGDGYKLNGHKHFAGGVGISDFYIIAAITDREKGTKGISLFIIEKGMPGLKITKVLKKMGLMGQPHGDLVLEDCYVPKENLLGQFNLGLKVIMSGIDIARLLVGAKCVGVGQAAFDDALNFARKRITFGKPIAEHQAVQMMLADMCVELDTCRLLVYQVARSMDKGISNVARECAMVKLYGSEIGKSVVDKSLQIHGSAGYVRGTPVERYYRDVRGWTIADGTSEIMRTTIARRLLKETQADPAVRA